MANTGKGDHFMTKTVRRFVIMGLIIGLQIARALSASAQGLQPRRTLGSRLARPAQTASCNADSAEEREARSARAAQRSQFAAGSLTAEFERERDTLFMDIVREAEICQTNLAEYATYPYWPDAMGVVSNFCEKENCVVVDVGHHFGSWRQGSWWQGRGKKAYVVRCNLGTRKKFVPLNFVPLNRRIWGEVLGSDGFCVISRGGSHTNFVYGGVGSICCYDSDGRFEEMYDSLDKIPGMKQCFDDELKVNYAEQDRWMKAHGFAEEGSGRDAEQKLDAARTNMIVRLKALRTILSSFPQWKIGSKWYQVCDVCAEFRDPITGGFNRSSSSGINTNDAVFVKMSERFENLGHSQDQLIAEFVRALTGLEFGSSTDTNGVLDLKFNLGSYETCTFGRGSGTGGVNRVTLIAEFEPDSEQNTIHEKLDMSLSTLLSAIGMDRDALAYNESANGGRPLQGGLRRPGGNQDWKSVRSFSQRFLISRSRQQSGEYVVTISDRNEVDVPAANNDARRTGGLFGGGGSLRARRLQRQQAAQAAAAKQQEEQAARDAERQAQAERERAQREAERAEQRQQLLAIQEELKRVREAKAAAANGECASSCVTNEPAPNGSTLPCRTLGSRRAQHKDEVQGTEKKSIIDGYTWSFSVRDGKATIVSPTGKLYKSAVSPKPTGEIVVPSSIDGTPVTGIGKFALCNSPELTGVKIPDGVTHIGEWAFSGCAKLVTVKIPSSVTGIEECVFASCPKLLEIELSPENPSFKAVKGVLYSKDMKHLVTCLGGVSSVTIPVGVTDIDNHAFRCCRNLKSVAIPPSVKKIGRDAFCGAVALESINIPSSIESIEGSTFWCCGQLKSVILPENLRSIGFRAFIGCNGLKTMTFPACMKNIENYAFEDCKGLTSVTMRGERPDSGDKVFDKCVNLKSIYVPANCKSWVGMKEWQGIPLVIDGKQQGQTTETAKDDEGPSANGASRVSDKPAQGKIVVADKLQSCDFLLNKEFKKNAKVYLCLFSASWCPPCRAEMPRIAKTYAETLKDDPDIELVHFSRDQNDEKALAWAKEHDVQFPVVKPKGGNPLDLHSRGIPHLFIVKADGALVEEGHPMNIFNEEKFREIKGASTTGAREPDADTCDVVSSDDMTGPYGIRMQPDPGCEKGALYVLKRLKDVYLPAAVRYYGDPFVGQKPTRVFTLHVKRNDGTGKRKYTGVSWGSCGDGIDSFTIGLAKGSDKWEMDLPLVASKILTVCSESDGAAFSIYANKFVRGEVDHCDPIPKIKEDIREGLRLRGEAEDKVKGRPWGLRKLAPTWAAFEELREKHPTLVLDYCNLKNSKYAKGELRQEISEDQMMALMSEVAGVDAAAIFKKHSAASISSTPQGKISVAEKLGQCDFLLNKDFKKKAKFYLCLFSASWCGPCRREMPRIAKAYAETLKDDPDIELIHFSRDQNDEKALAWAKEHDVKFPVVKPRGGNPLDLHCNGIPHLFIVKADGTLVEEGHPMRIFNEEKFREIRGKLKNLAVKEEANTSMNIAASMETKASDVKWTYELFNGAIRLGVGCRGNALKSPSDVFGELVIPAEIEGVPVRYIGANAFHSRNFTSVTIPSSVREIDYSAFIWCKRLKSVTISSGLTTLGRFSPFGYCQELKSFCVDPDNPSFCSRDGLLCSKDGATLVAGVNGNVTIPMGVTRISDEAFYGCLALKSVSIPSCVTDIGRAAFLSCRALKSVTVPHSVSSIGEQAFGWCSELTNIVVETSNVSYSSENGVLYNKAKTELLCWPAGRSGAGVIPSSVASIGRSAFSRCEGLTSLTMPKNVKRIGNGAFENCRTLTTVVLHGECPDSPDNIFNGCKNLNSIHVPANAKSWAGMKHWKGIPLVFDAETKK